MIKGFDVDQGVGPLAPRIADAGYRFVCRYLKNLTVAEAQALSDAGLKIVSIWERRGDRGSFSAAQGAFDGGAAAERARALGQPPDTVIVNAIDFDAQPADLHRIVEHFHAVALQIAPYRVGAYGNGLALGTLIDNGHIDIAYLAGSVGWTGSHAFDAANRWHIRQHPTIRSAELGISIDPCDAFALDDHLGAWSMGRSVPTVPTVKVLAANFEGTVAELQRVMQARGFYNGRIDGDFGPASRQAFARWKASG